MFQLSMCSGLCYARHFHESSSVSVVVRKASVAKQPCIALSWHILGLLVKFQPLYQLAARCVLYLNCLHECTAMEEAGRGGACSAGTMPEKDIVESGLEVSCANQQVRTNLVGVKRRKMSGVCRARQSQSRKIKPWNDKMDGAW
jgi:hypothetical protein